VFFNGARMLQISTEGVFSGARGANTENDLPDSSDEYGDSKILGEV
jgi:dTDP-4-dehydrorhamnose reductase